MAHPAGPRHAEDTRHGGVPPRPNAAEDMLHLAPNVWPRNAVRGDGGVVGIAGVLHVDWPPSTARRCSSSTRTTSGRAAASIAAAFGGGDHVRYAAKAFLCSEIARWVDQEGLSLDVCSGGELAVALNADFPPDRIALHGNNKSVAELTAAVKAGIGARRAGLDDRDRAPRRHRRRGRRRSGRAGARHRRRRGAHPRVHLHRARGPEVRSVAGQRRGDGRRPAGVRRRPSPPGGPAQPHRLADLRRRAGSSSPPTG